MKLLAFSLCHFSSRLVLCTNYWEVAGGEKEREHDEIGVPDRPREEEPGLDSSYYIMEPFGV